MASAHKNKCQTLTSSKEELPRKFDYSEPVVRTKNLFMSIFDTITGPSVFAQEVETSVDGPLHLGNVDQHVKVRSEMVMNVSSEGGAASLKPVQVFCQANSEVPIKNSCRADQEGQGDIPGIHGKDEEFDDEEDDADDGDEKEDDLLDAGDSNDPCRRPCRSGTMDEDEAGEEADDEDDDNEDDDCDDDDDEDDDDDDDDEEGPDAEGEDDWLEEADNDDDEKEKGKDHGKCKPCKQSSSPPKSEGGMGLVSKFASFISRTDTFCRSTFTIERLPSFNSKPADESPIPEDNEPEKPFALVEQTVETKQKPCRPDPPPESPPKPAMKTEAKAAAAAEPKPAAKADECVKPAAKPEEKSKAVEKAKAKPGKDAKADAKQDAKKDQKKDDHMAEIRIPATYFPCPSPPNDKKDQKPKAAPKEKEKEKGKEKCKEKGKEKEKEKGKEKGKEKPKEDKPVCEGVLLSDEKQCQNGDEDEEEEEEIINELHQDCLYMTPEEFRAVCDKYKSYDSARGPSPSPDCFQEEKATSTEEWETDLYHDHDISFTGKKDKKVSTDQEEEEDPEWEKCITPPMYGCYDAFDRNGPDVPDYFVEEKPADKEKKTEECEGSPYAEELCIKKPICSDDANEPAYADDALEQGKAKAAVLQILDETEPRYLDDQIKSQRKTDTPSDDLYCKAAIYEDDLGAHYERGKSEKRRRVVICFEDEVDKYVGDRGANTSKIVYKCFEDEVEPGNLPLSDKDFEKFALPKPINEPPPCIYTDGNIDGNRMANTTGSYFGERKRPRSRTRKGGKKHRPEKESDYFIKECSNTFVDMKKGDGPKKKNSLGKSRLRNSNCNNNNSLGDSDTESDEEDGGNKAKKEYDDDGEDLDDDGDEAGEEGDNNYASDRTDDESNIYFEENKNETGDENDIGLVSDDGFERNYQSEEESSLFNDTVVHKNEVEYDSEEDGGLNDTSDSLHSRSCSEFGEDEDADEDDFQVKCVAYKPMDMNRNKSPSHMFERKKSHDLKSGSRTSNSATSMAGETEIDSDLAIAAQDNRAAGRSMSEVSCATVKSAKSLSQEEMPLSSKIATYASFQFEHCKRVFESLKNRALSGEREMLFEEREPIVENTSYPILTSLQAIGKQEDPKRSEDKSKKSLLDSFIDMIGFAPAPEKRLEERKRSEKVSRDREREREESLNRLERLKEREAARKLSPRRTRPRAPAPTRVPEPEPEREPEPELQLEPKREREREPELQLEPKREREREREWEREREREWEREREPELDPEPEPKREREPLREPEPEPAPEPEPEPIVSEVVEKKKTFKFGTLKHKTNIRTLEQAGYAIVQLQDRDRQEKQGKQKEWLHIKQKGSPADFDKRTISETSSSVAGSPETSVTQESTTTIAFAAGDTRETVEVDKHGKHTIGMDTTPTANSDNLTHRFLRPLIISSDLGHFKGAGYTEFPRIDVLEVPSEYTEMPGVPETPPRPNVSERKDQIEYPDFKQDTRPAENPNLFNKQIEPPDFKDSKNQDLDQDYIKYKKESRERDTKPTENPNLYSKLGEKPDFRDSTNRDLDQDYIKYKKEFRERDTKPTENPNLYNKVGEKPDFRDSTNQDLDPDYIKYKKEFREHMERGSTDIIVEKKPIEYREFGNGKKQKESQQRSEQKKQTETSGVSKQDKLAIDRQPSEHRKIVQYRIGTKKGKENSEISEAKKLNQPEKDVQDSKKGADHRGAQYKKYASPADYKKQNAFDEPTAPPERDEYRKQSERDHSQQAEREDNSKSDYTEYLQITKAGDVGQSSPKLKGSKPKSKKMPQSKSPEKIEFEDVEKIKDAYLSALREISASGSHSEASAIVKKKSHNFKFGAPVPKNSKHLQDFKRKEPVHEFEKVVPVDEFNRDESRTEFTTNEPAVQEPIRYEGAQVPKSIEPAYESIIEPAYEPSIEPAYEPSIEPAYEPSIEPAYESTKIEPVPAMEREREKNQKFSFGQFRSKQYATPQGYKYKEESAKKKEFQRSFLKKKHRTDVKKNLDHEGDGDNASDSGGENLTVKTFEGTTLDDEIAQIRDSIEERSEELLWCSRRSPQIKKEKEEDDPKVKILSAYKGKMFHNIPKMVKEGKDNKKSSDGAGEIVGRGVISETIEKQLPGLLDNKADQVRLSEDLERRHMGSLTPNVYRDTGSRTHIAGKKHSRRDGSEEVIKTKAGNGDFIESKANTSHFSKVFGKVQSQNKERGKSKERKKYNFCSGRNDDEHNMMDDTHDITNFNCRSICRGGLESPKFNRGALHRRVEYLKHEENCPRKVPEILSRCNEGMIHHSPVLVNNVMVENILPTQLDTGKEKQKQANCPTYLRGYKEKIQTRVDDLNGDVDSEEEDTELDYSESHDESEELYASNEYKSDSSRTKCYYQSSEDSDFTSSSQKSTTGIASVHVHEMYLNMNKRTQLVEDIARVLEHRHAQAKELENDWHTQEPEIENGVTDNSAYQNDNGGDTDKLKTAESDGTHSVHKEQGDIGLVEKSPSPVHMSYDTSRYEKQHAKDRGDAYSARKDLPRTKAAKTVKEDVQSGHIHSQKSEDRGCIAFRVKSQEELAKAAMIRPKNNEEKDVNNTEQSTAKLGEISLVKSEESSVIKPEDSSVDKSGDGSVSKSEENSVTKSEESPTADSEESSIAKPDKDSTAKSEESSVVQSEESSDTKAENLKAETAEGKTSQKDLNDSSTVETSSSSSKDEVNKTNQEASNKKGVDPQILSQKLDKFSKPERKKTENFEMKVFKKKESSPSRSPQRNFNDAHRSNKSRIFAGKEVSSPQISPQRQDRFSAAERKRDKEPTMKEELSPKVSPHRHDRSSRHDRRNEKTKDKDSSLKISPQRYDRVSRHERKKENTGDKDSIMKTESNLKMSPQRHDRFSHSVLNRHKNSDKNVTGKAEHKSMKNDEKLFKSPNLFDRIARSGWNTSPHSHDRFPKSPNLNEKKSQANLNEKKSQANLNEKKSQSNKHKSPSSSEKFSNHPVSIERISHSGRNKSPNASERHSPSAKNRVVNLAKEDTGKRELGTLVSQLRNEKKGAAGNKTKFSHQDSKSAVEQSVSQIKQTEKYAMGVELSPEYDISDVISDMSDFKIEKSLADTSRASSVISSLADDSSPKKRDRDRSSSDTRKEKKAIVKQVDGKASVSLPSQRKAETVQMNGPAGSESPRRSRKMKDPYEIKTCAFEKGPSEKGRVESPGVVIKPHILSNSDRTLNIEHQAGGGARRHKRPPFFERKTRAKHDANTADFNAQSNPIVLGSAYNSYEANTGSGKNGPPPSQDKDNTYPKTLYDNRAPQMGAGETLHQNEKANQVVSPKKRPFKFKDKSKVRSPTRDDSSNSEDDRSDSQLTRTSTSTKSSLSDLTSSSKVSDSHKGRGKPKIAFSSTTDQNTASTTYSVQSAMKPDAKISKSKSSNASQKSTSSNKSNPEKSTPSSKYKVEKSTSKSKLSSDGAAKGDNSRATDRRKPLESNSKVKNEAQNPKDRNQRTPTNSGINSVLDKYRRNDSFATNSRISKDSQRTTRIDLPSDVQRSGRHRDNGGLITPQPLQESAVEDKVEDLSEQRKKYQGVKSFVITSKKGVSGVDVSPTTFKYPSSSVQISTADNSVVDTLRQVIEEDKKGNGKGSQSSSTKPLSSRVGRSIEVTKETRSTGKNGLGQKGLYPRNPQLCSSRERIAMPRQEPTHLPNKAFRVPNDSCGGYFVEEIDESSSARRNGANRGNEQSPFNLLNSNLRRELQRDARPGYRHENVQTYSQAREQVSRLLQESKGNSVDSNVASGERFSTENYRSNSSRIKYNPPPATRAHRFAWEEQKPVISQGTVLEDHRQGGHLPSFRISSNTNRYEKAPNTASYSPEGVNQTTDKSNEVRGNNIAFSSHVNSTATNPLAPDYSKQAGDSATKKEPEKEEEEPPRERIGLLSRLLASLSGSSYQKPAPEQGKGDEAKNKNEKERQEKNEPKTNKTAGFSEQASSRKYPQDKSGSTYKYSSRSTHGRDPNINVAKGRKLHPEFKENKNSNADSYINLKKKKRKAAEASKQEIVMSSERSTRDVGTHYLYKKEENVDKEIKEPAGPVERVKQVNSKLKSVIFTTDAKIVKSLSLVVEWNAILLFVIFALFLGTCCPGTLRRNFACPPASFCESIYNNLLSHFEFDDFLNRWFGPSKTSFWKNLCPFGDKPPPKGVIYTLVYYLLMFLFNIIASMFYLAYEYVLAPYTSLFLQSLHVLAVAIACTLRDLFEVAKISFLAIFGLSGQTASGRAGSMTTRAKSHEGFPEFVGPDEVTQVPANLDYVRKHGSFFFYLGFDEPKEGCDFSYLTGAYLWLRGRYPAQCL